MLTTRKLTHNVSSAVEAVSERRLEELHRQVHVVVGGERLDDAEQTRERGEYAESGPTAPPNNIIQR